MTVDVAPRGPLGAPSIPPIRVLVVDDSAIVRGLVSRQLETDVQIKVVGSAHNGQVALDMLGRCAADVVVLDVEMPVMDGLTALPLMLAAQPHLKIVMASTLTRRNAEVSLRALQLGASDCIAKPEGSLGSADEFKRDLIAKVKALGPATRSVTPVAALATAAGASFRPARRVTPTALAIGASTGGPPALLKLFEALRGAVEQPIFLTQHMPATFTALLSEQLSRVGLRPCREGQEGERVEPGRCYVAPGGWHMTVGAGRQGPTIHLNQDPPENFCRPAVDPMFRSLASVYGAGLVGVMLTGMGSDGAKGCVALADAGGRFAVQDEATSIVWGMPGAAANTGRAERILPLDEIGPWVRMTMAVTT
ncbi:chemotaxis response regulator protein-glutamate methylesterase [uncultured Phenylobacterium sp.]|uniref:protein-glutamate methylesterase/protein-glutamine glutaminase n=1 Tax=uncultured Phenylobacterium sp. TaxID=349273 RepID=UPI0025D6338A|nr:chemotaxis response regulator protein-glutamate methylesterase [uncultured Phenylobacterium sp.]